VIVSVRRFIQRSRDDVKDVQNYSISQPEQIFLPFILFRGKVVGSKISPTITEGEKSVIYEERLDGYLQVPVKIISGDFELNLNFGEDIFQDYNLSLKIIPLAEVGESTILNIQNLEHLKVWETISTDVIKRSGDRSDISIFHSMIVERRSVLLLIPVWVISVRYKEERFRCVMRDIDGTIVSSQLPHKKMRKGRLTFFLGLAGLSMGITIKGIFSQNLILSVISIILLIFSAFASFKMMKRYFIDIKLKQVYKI